eukprot:3416443-Rhodomonas_salina.1
MTVNRFDAVWCNCNHWPPRVSVANMFLRALECDQRGVGYECHARLEHVPLLASEVHGAVAQPPHGAYDVPGVQGAVFAEAVDAEKRWRWGGGLCKQRKHRVDGRECGVVAKPARVSEHEADGDFLALRILDVHAVEAHVSHGLLWVRGWQAVSCTDHPVRSYK